MARDFTKIIIHKKLKQQLQSGIANTNLVEIDSADVAAGEYARFTANGLESRSIAEVKQALNYAIDSSDVSLSDNTTNDASTTKHGLLPKLPNDSTKYLNGIGEWAAASGSGKQFITTALIAQYGYWDAPSGKTLLRAYDVSSTTENASINFNTEADYVQEDATNGTDFSGGAVTLHAITSAGRQNPNMTSPTSPSGTVFATHQHSTYQAWRAFEGSTASDSCWNGLSWNGTDVCRIGYQFTSSNITLNRCQITVGGDTYVSNRTPNALSIEYSSDGANYTSVYSTSGLSWSNGETKTFDFSTVTGGPYWAVRITAANGDAYYVHLNEISFINTNATYVTNTPYWVKTGANSRISYTNKEGIQSITMTPSSQATNTNVRMLISLDQGTTWKGYDGTAWINVGTLTYANATNYNTFISNISSLSIPINGTVDVMTFHYSTSASATSSVDNLQFTFIVNGGDNVIRTIGTDITEVANTGLAKADFESGNFVKRYQRQASGSAIMRMEVI